MIQVIRKRKLYRKEYKSDVVRKVIAGFDPSWEYHPYSKVDENHYRTSRLHSTHFDRYRGEDMIKGSIEKTDFEFSELHLTREETHTDSEGKVEKKTVTVFKGIFAHMDFNKEIKSNTFVSPDAGKALGKLGR